MRKESGRARPASKGIVPVYKIGKRSERARIRLGAQVDERRQAKDRATFRAAPGKCLRVHELDDSTRQSLEMYARLRWRAVGALRRRRRRLVPDHHLQAEFTGRLRSAP
jgi:hypothetical protein